MGALASHVANMIKWTVDTMEKTEFDLASVTPEEMNQSAKNRKELLEWFDANVPAARAVLAKSDADYSVPWTLKNGEMVFFTMPRYTCVRSFVPEPHRPPPRAAQCVSAAERRARARRYGPSRGRDVKNSQGSQRGTEATEGVSVCAFVSSETLCVLVLYRAARGLRLQLSARRVAAGSAGRSRGGARLSGARAAGSRRRLRRAALPQGGARGGHPADHWSGADDRAEGQKGRSQKSRVQVDSDYPALSPPAFVLPVLCESAEGYRNLCRLITRMKMRAPKGEGALALESSTAARPASSRSPAAPRSTAGGTASAACSIGSSASSAATASTSSCSVIFAATKQRDNAALVALAAAFRVPTIATNGVRFATPAERPLFDVLTCIHHHTTLADAGRRLAPNAERYLKPPADMAALFRDEPGAVARTGELADRLRYTMADLGYRFPDYPVPAGETQTSFLRKIADVGARERYRPFHDKARAQIARELDLIEKLELAGYFLIVWDIVNFCRQHDILVQGRGSAANSAVCYSLGITAVDPVGMDLLFERFLSEERGEWPDIDLDLPSGDRREQVIQHVYEKYGRLGAAMTANVITYRGRSAAREVGKALGFEPAQIDRLAKVMNNFEFVDPADTLSRHLTSVGLDLNAERVQLFARRWHEMQDLPRHLGQHSGGMVICQGQLDAVVPLENATMPGRVVVQWDKDDCAEMGIVKVDLLGLGMMAVIQDSLALVNGEMQTAENAKNAEKNIISALSACSAVKRPIIDLAHLPQNDPLVYKMLCEADTIGVFQVESRAQMATLPRLKPKEFYDLVVQVAIIRPGPIVGQMVHPYLNRRAGREPVQYAASLARADSRADARRAALSGTAAADGDGRRRLHRRPGRRAAARHGLQALGAAHEADRSPAARRDGAPGDYRRRRRANHHVDRVVRAVRISRIARRQLRAAGVRERVPEGPLPGGLLHRAAQQPADGVLSPRHARQGRAAPRRPVSSHRRPGLELGLHRGERWRHPPRAALRARVAGAGRPQHL